MADDDDVARALGGGGLAAGLAAIGISVGGLARPRLPGPAGPVGPAGPSTGPAGGALNGTYPNPGLAIPGVQLNAGGATLASGVATIVDADLAVSSTVNVTLETPSGTTLTTQYAVLAADRTNGVGFKITALIAAGTINVADNSSVRWSRIN